MIQSYLKRAFFIVLIFISIQSSNQIIESTVKGIKADSYPCSKSKAQYDFDIIISSFSIQLVLLILLLLIYKPLMEGN